MESLTDYKKQLNMVCIALQKECNEHLLSLKEDLEEMIALLEEQADASQRANDDEPQPMNEDDICDEDNNGNDLTGVKCSVKYDSPGLSNTLHNAMVFGIDETSDAKVRVLFLYPLNVAMKTCEDFLNGNCKYGSLCRFSHGYSVNVTELEEYIEPDFENLRVGTCCLAKNMTDDLWYPAVIEFIVNAEKCVVRYRNINSTIELPFTDIYPTGDFMDNDDFDERNDTTDSSDVCNNSSKADPQKNQFACWEVHTKRIASKLMAKMGYVPGKGLGKHSDGRVEPVTVKVLPKGSSLDTVMSLNKLKKLKNPIVVKKTNLKKKKRGEDGPFDLINNSLRNKGKRMTKTLDTKIPQQLPITVQLVLIEDHIRNLTEKIIKLRNVLETRDICGDRRGLMHVNQKIEYEENCLRILKVKESELKQKQIRQKSIEQLTQF